MTRFQRELSGELGAAWQRSAEQELEKIREELKQGLITIDENGVARNRIGRVLMDDLLERLLMVTDEADEEATRAAREEEVAKSLEAYRKANQNRRRSSEELNEMRAAFGTGTTVVDIFTGERIAL